MKLPKKLEVKVEERHIKEGRRRNGESCAIALALNEKFGKISSDLKHDGVSCEYLEVTNGDDYYSSRTYRPGNKARKFISAFDNKARRFIEPTTVYFYEV